MRRPFVLLGAVVALSTAWAGPMRAGQQDLSRDEANRMEQKLAVITARAAIARGQLGAPVPTSFTDREVNAYFRYNGHDKLPPGVTDPQITIEDSGRVDAQAVVDLDTVRKSQPQSTLGALLLHGVIEVKASAMIEAAGGKGTVRIASVTVGGIPVPASMLQSIVSQYTRTPDLPDGFQLDQPFDLPANIREVHLQRGAATIVQ
jgi:hypothetical protein